MATNPLRILGVIPARYASSRFPGKPLIDLKGKTMIQRVYEGVKKSNVLTDVIVATDDARIEAEVLRFGGKVMMTSPKHPSGTDRCGEVAKIYSNYDVIINIQGDEPLVDFRQIDQLASAFLDAKTSIATLGIKQVSMEDMEKTGELGFAKGMSRIIMNNLNAIDVCKRPIHCSDVKRETLYVKNNGVWEKETEERKRTKEIIYKVSRLNLKELLKWRDLPRNKGYEKSDHTKNDEFTNLVMEINKMREEEFDKIITSVSKHVAIDKEKVKDKVKMSGYLN